jgi:hypothetical protein
MFAHKANVVTQKRDGLVSIEGAVAIIVVILWQLGFGLTSSLVLRTIEN